MPKYNNDYTEGQDWDVISWNKTEITNDTNNEKEDLSFNRKLILARQKAQYTQHQLAQELHIKVIEVTLFENGHKIPEKKILYKINKLLTSKLTI